MDNKTPVTVFWFRRDLRMEDNAGLYHALKSGNPVLPFFIFDKKILNDLEDKDDARVAFIYKAVNEVNRECIKHGSSLKVVYDTPEHAFSQLIQEHKVSTVYTNHDYEPYAKARDEGISQLLAKYNIVFKTFKDQVIFEKDEIMKDDGAPYTVYTPYNRKWYQKLKPFYLKAYPTERYFSKLFQFNAAAMPTLTRIFNIIILFAGLSLISPLPGMRRTGLLMRPTTNQGSR